jgi:hypothetical protein
VARRQWEAPKGRVRPGPGDPSLTLDWSALQSAFLGGLAWGIGFAIPFFIGATYAAFAIMSHPTAKKLARAADKISGASNQGIVSQILQAILSSLLPGKGKGGEESG